MKMKFLTDLFTSLRIPTEDSDNYVEELRRLGYDDVQALKEDATPDVISSFMKQGHVKRLQSYFKTSEHKSLPNPVSAKVLSETSSSGSLDDFKAGGPLGLNIPRRNYNDNESELKPSNSYRVFDIDISKIKNNNQNKTKIILNKKLHGLPQRAAGQRRTTPRSLPNAFWSWLRKAMS